MPPVRAIGFDLDGTLFDHAGASRAAADAFVAGLGVEPTAATRRLWLDAEALHFERWRSGELSFDEQRRERLRSVLPALGLPVPSAIGDLDAQFATYLAEYRHAWRAFADVAALLDALRADGLRLGLLTNGSSAQQRDKLDAVGLRDAFDVVCISEEIGAPKPDARAFHALADGLGVDVAECLYVGDDVDKDLRGARGAGMRALLVDRDGEHRGGIVDVVRVAAAR